MMRIFVISLLMFLIYWFVRRLVRSFLKGMNPENRNVRGSDEKPKEMYKDVQDADFTDISDQQKPPAE